jgi:hypothetical protein
MSIMAPSAPPLDRAGAFAALAERERLAQLAQRYLSGRGRGPSRSSPMIRA